MPVVPGATMRRDAQKKGTAAEEEPLLPGAGAAVPEGRGDVDDAPPGERLAALAVAASAASAAAGFASEMAASKIQVRRLEGDGGGERMHGCKRARPPASRAPLQPPPPPHLRLKMGTPCETGSSAAVRKTRARAARGGSTVTSTSMTRVSEAAAAAAPPLPPSVAAVSVMRQG